jgi:hypothetical protein
MIGWIEILQEAPQIGLLHRSTAGRHGKRAAAEVKKYCAARARENMGRGIVTDE